MNSNSGLKALLLQLQDIVSQSRPAVESFWVGLVIAAAMGALAIVTDNATALTPYILIGGALSGVSDYLTSKARHEDAKAIQAEADQRIADVLTPPVGSDDF